MMSHSFNPLTATRRHLIQQLVFFDEQYSMFYDQFLSGLPDSERSIIENKVKQYISALTTLLGHTDAELAKQLKSVVLIGSEVQARYIEDNYIEKYTLVYPSESDPDKHRISFLSPFGRQLLNADTGAQVEISVPSGTYQVAVESVRFSFIGGFDID